MNLTGVLEAAQLSDAGRKRNNNEDSLAVDLSLGLVLVADGMGGHAAGEVASAIATQTVHQRLGEVLEGLEHGDVDPASGEAVELSLIRAAVAAANRAIFEAAAARPSQHGMGTTLVMGLFYDNRIAIAHIGDSRLYRLRGESFERLTRDHSLAEDMVSEGFYSTLEDANATASHVLTRALGVEESVEAELREELADPEDVYLLCSDGLTDMVSDPEIHLTLSRFSANLQLAAEKLVELANDNGGRDNVSVVLARPKKAFPVRRSWQDRVADWFI